MESGPEPAAEEGCDQGDGDESSPPAEPTLFVRAAVALHCKCIYAARFLVACAHGFTVTTPLSLSWPG